MKINIDKEEKTIVIEDVELNENENVVVKEKTHSKHKYNLKGKIAGATPLISTLLFLLIGFTTGIWHPTWVIFFAIPLVPTLLYMNVKKKSGIMNLISLSIVIIFILLCIFGYAHPGWLIFFLIPIAAIFIEK